MPDEKRTPVLANVAILVVLTAWTVNFGARFFIPSYEPNVSLDAMLMAVLGFVLVGKSRTDPGDAVPHPGEEPRRDGEEREP